MLSTLLYFNRDIELANQRAYEDIKKWGFTRGAPDPDLLVLKKPDEKKSIGIEDAKKSRKFLAEKPFFKSKKVIVIESAHLLTTEAQNSLLNSLEESPAYALIILTVNDLDLIIETVRSRCALIKITDDKGAKKATQTSLWELSVADKLLLAEAISKKTKEEVLVFLEECIYADRFILEELAPSEPSYKEKVEVYEKLVNMHQDLKRSNTSVRFALEYVFLLHNAII